MMEHGTIPLPSNSKLPAVRSIKKDEATFAEVVRLIAMARERTTQDVNPALIDLYWKVGEIISHKIEAAEWVDGVVDRLAQFIARTDRGVLFGSELAKTTEPCVKFLRERPFRARFEFSELYFTQQTGGLSWGITLREISANRPGRELTSPRPE